MTTTSPQNPVAHDQIVDDALSRTADSRPNHRMWLERPRQDTAVVHVTGELDLAATPRLRDLLAPRLASTLDAIIIDLSQVDFLGTAPLSALAEFQQRALARGITFSIVTGPRCVTRALRATGLTEHFATYAAPGLALATRSIE